MLTRHQREREFHNRTFGGDPEGRDRRVEKYYSVSYSFVNYKASIIRDCRDARVLEYGCGPGSSSFLLARNGASVTGIDLSEVAIEQARGRAKEEGLERIRFLEMNAEDLDFPDDSFDLVCGSAILHHLDLEQAYSELSRVLKPGGRAVFVEPLGHNPAINLYRRLTPKIRTEDEHPLLMRDLRAAERYFGRVDGRFFQFATFLAVPFRAFGFSRQMRLVLDRIDAAMFTWIPVTRRLAWQVVVEFSRPRKVGSRRTVATDGIDVR